jgi:hypothetical protein
MIAYTATTKTIVTGMTIGGTNQAFIALPLPMSVKLTFAVPEQLLRNAD